MMASETQPWIDRALSGQPVWSIGQIDKATERALNRLVKAGTLIRCRAHWQGISSLKTLWCLPTTTFSYLEYPAVVEAHGAALMAITKPA